MAEHTYAKKYSEPVTRNHVKLSSRNAISPKRNRTHMRKQPKLFVCPQNPSFSNDKRSISPNSNSRRPRFSLKKIKNLKTSRLKNYKRRNKYHLQRIQYASSTPTPPSLLLFPNVGVPGLLFSWPKKAIFSLNATYSESAYPNASCICVLCKPLILRISLAE
jgi:hypothetical protein